MVQISKQEIRYSDKLNSITFFFATICYSWLSLEKQFFLLSKFDAAEEMILFAKNLPSKLNVKINP